MNFLLISRFSLSPIVSACDRHGRTQSAGVHMHMHTPMNSSCTCTCTCLRFEWHARGDEQTACSRSMSMPYRWCHPCCMMAGGFVAPFAMESLLRWGNMSSTLSFSSPTKSSELATSWSNTCGRVRGAIGLDCGVRGATGLDSGVPTIGGQWQHDIRHRSSVRTVGSQLPAASASQTSRE